MKAFTDSEIKSKTVCIIGAGPCGTSLLHAFNEAKKQGEAVPETIVCYDKQGQIGGLWNYSPRIGVDVNGEPEHCGMYQHLWSNGPKECLEFMDYSFDEHFKKPIPSFPPREVLYEYITSRLLNKGVEMEKQCRLNHVVRRVTWFEERKKFIVVTHDLAKSNSMIQPDIKIDDNVEGKKDEDFENPTRKKINNHFDFEFTEEFDYVIVATGHFSSPNIPNFKGLETFKNGRVLHSHDFRDARDFCDKTILVIGTSYSGEDIACQCYKFGCKHVYLSWRTAPMQFHWPDGKFTTVGLLEKIVTENGRSACYFKGVLEPVWDIDSIILCTGYLHDFRFMSDSLRLKTANRLWIDSLYKGIFWNENPNLMYMGMHDQWYTYNMFDAQAWLIRDFILGKYQQPVACTRQRLFDVILKKRDDEKSAEEKKAEQNFKETKMWLDRETDVMANPTDKLMFEYQGDYVKDLCDLTDYPSVDVPGINQLFDDWEHDKHKDIMTYREQVHKSTVTGTLGRVPQKPWLQSFDDSLKTFLTDSHEQKTNEYAADDVQATGCCL